MPSVRDLKIKLFADGANLAEIEEMAKNPLISGFTTNPTLMRKAGVSNYKKFAMEALRIVDGKPISFEVFSDEFDEMERQAREIASWGENVYVKVPVTNAKRKFSGLLIKRLSYDGVKLNITAVMTLDQVLRIARWLDPRTPAITSVFAGRIADTGRDPVPLMTRALSLLHPEGKSELLWASPRELLNVFHADEIGCHIITATSEILRKLSLIDKDLDDYSLETVKQFYDDAQAAGYTID